MRDPGSLGRGRVRRQLLVTRNPAGVRHAATSVVRLVRPAPPRPLTEVRRPHVELYARDLESRGLAAATVVLKLVVLTGFYRYCVEEQLLEHSPAAHVRRPKISQESTRLGLDRNEIGAFLVQAGLAGGNDHVLACLLALNTLRISEACGADLCDLAFANGHRTLRIVGKGNQPALIPLAPRTARAIDTSVSERNQGPLLQRANGSRSIGMPRDASSVGSPSAPASTSRSRPTRSATPPSPQPSTPVAASET